MNNLIARADKVFNKYKRLEKTYNLNVEVLERENNWILSFYYAGYDYIFRSSYNRADSGFFKINKNTRNERKITEKTFEKNFRALLNLCRSSKL